MFTRKRKDRSESRAERPGKDKGKELKQTLTLETTCSERPNGRTDSKMESGRSSTKQVVLKPTQGPMRLFPGKIQSLGGKPDPATRRVKTATNAHSTAKRLKMKQKKSLDNFFKKTTGTRDIEKKPRSHGMVTRSQVASNNNREHNCIDASSSTGSCTMDLDEYIRKRIERSLRSVTSGKARKSDSSSGLTLPLKVRNIWRKRPWTVGGSFHKKIRNGNKRMKKGSMYQRGTKPAAKKSRPVIWMTGRQHGSGKAEPRKSSGNGITKKRMQRKSGTQSKASGRSKSGKTSNQGKADNQGKAEKRSLTGTKAKQAPATGPVKETTQSNVAGQGHRAGQATGTCQTAKTAEKTKSRRSSCNSSDNCAASTSKKPAQKRSAGDDKVGNRKSAPKKQTSESKGCQKKQANDTSLVKKNKSTTSDRAKRQQSREEIQRGQSEDAGVNGRTATDVRGNDKKRKVAQSCEKKVKSDVTKKPSSADHDDSEVPQELPQQNLVQSELDSVQPQPDPVQSQPDTVQSQPGSGAASPLLPDYSSSESTITASEARSCTSSGTSTREVSDDSDDSEPDLDDGDRALLNWAVTTLTNAHQVPNGPFVQNGIFQWPINPVRTQLPPRPYGSTSTRWLGPTSAPRQETCLANSVPLPDDSEDDTQAGPSAVPGPSHYYNYRDDDMSPQVNQNNGRRQLPDGMSILHVPDGMSTPRLPDGMSVFQIPDGMSTPEAVRICTALMSAQEDDSSPGVSRHSRPLQERGASTSSHSAPNFHQYPHHGPGQWGGVPLTDREHVNYMVPNVPPVMDDHHMVPAVPPAVGHHRSLPMLGVHGHELPSTSSMPDFSPHARNHVHQSHSNPCTIHGHYHCPRCEDIQHMPHAFGPGNRIPPVWQGFEQQHNNYPLGYGVRPNIGLPVMDQEYWQPRGTPPMPPGQELPRLFPPLPHLRPHLFPPMRQPGQYSLPVQQHGHCHGVDGFHLIPHRFGERISAPELHRSQPLAGSRQLMPITRSRCQVPPQPNEQSATRPAPRSGTRPCTRQSGMKFTRTVRVAGEKIIVNVMTTPDVRDEDEKKQFKDLRGAKEEDYCWPNTPGCSNKEEIRRCVNAICKEKHKKVFNKTCTWHLKTLSFRQRRTPHKALFSPKHEMTYKYCREHRYCDDTSSSDDDDDDYVPPPKRPNRKGPK